MYFSDYKDCKTNKTIDLEAVEDMKFATIEQSELFQKYKSAYSFRWLYFLFIAYAMLEALVGISELFIFLLPLFIIMLVFETAIRKNIVLKCKAYCLGLIELKTFTKWDRFILYYSEFLDLLALIISPIFFYQIHFLYFS